MLTLFSLAIFARVPIKLSVQLRANRGVTIGLTISLLSSKMRFTKSRASDTASSEDSLKVRFD